MRPSLREASIDFRLSARDRCPVIVPFNAALGASTEIRSTGATAAICLIVSFIFYSLSLGENIASALAFAKDYLPCLSIPRRHTFRGRWSFDTYAISLPWGK